MTPPLHAPIEFRVRYAESDQMGFVYHANYLVWCDMGRTELIRRVWRPYSELERGGLLLAVTEASLRFLAPARFDDLVRVDTILESVRSRSVAFTYDISRVDDGGDARRLVTARTVLMALDPSGAPRTLPPDMVQAFRDAQASMGASA
jgi:acyl-CoA thioester hydrolase